ncbi:MAG: hypothetical protein MUE51_06620 [Thermoleophilia bacterium]|jgi:hypothetical protein|nr:hypothetical protein [Thermoleophilia bacterium]
MARLRLLLALILAALAAGPAAADPPRLFDTIPPPDHAVWSGVLSPPTGAGPIEIRYRPGDEATALALAGALPQAWDNAGWVTAGRDRRVFGLVVYVVPNGTIPGQVCANTGSNLMSVSIDRSGCDLPEESFAHELVHWRMFGTAVDVEAEPTNEWLRESAATYGAFRMYPAALGRVRRGAALLARPGVPLHLARGDAAYDAYLFWRFLGRSGLEEMLPRVVSRFADGERGRDALLSAFGSPGLLARTVGAFWVANMNPRWGYGDPVPAGRVPAPTLTVSPGRPRTVTLGASALAADVVRIEVAGDVTGLRVRPRGVALGDAVMLGVHRGRAVQAEDAGDGWGVGRDPSAGPIGCRAPDPPAIAVSGLDVAVTTARPGAARVTLEVSAAGRPERECDEPPTSCPARPGAGGQVQTGRCGWQVRRRIATRDFSGTSVGTTCARDGVGRWRWSARLHHRREGAIAVDWVEDLAFGGWRAVASVRVRGLDPVTRSVLRQMFATVRHRVAGPRSNPMVWHRSFLGTFQRYPLSSAEPVADCGG